MAFSAVFCRRNGKEDSGGFLGDAQGVGGREVMSLQSSVGHLLRHCHLEAGHRLLWRDLGFQSLSHIFPLHTHDLVQHMGLERQLYH